MPKRIEKKTICRMSPFAKASTTLEGTMCVRKSLKLIAFPCAAYCETSPRAMDDTSRPAPGLVTFTTMSPIASANVVTTSK